MALRVGTGASTNLDDMATAAYGRFMGNRRPNAKTFGLMSIALLIAGAVVVWISRRSSTDHDVSDPGVTL